MSPWIVYLKSIVLNATILSLPLLSSSTAIPRKKMVSVRYAKYAGIKRPKFTMLVLKYGSAITPTIKYMQAALE